MVGLCTQKNNFLFWTIFCQNSYLYSNLVARTLSRLVEKSAGIFKERPGRGL